LRSPWKAARRWTTRLSAQESSTRSRSSCESEAKRRTPPPAMAHSRRVFHRPSSWETCLRSAARGLRATMPSSASGTPISVADGRPSPPGTKVSQMASRAARAFEESPGVLMGERSGTGRPLSRPAEPRRNHILEAAAVVFATTNRMLCIT
jgi:hypothetical protein